MEVQKYDAQLYTELKSVKARIEYRVALLAVNCETTISIKTSMKLWAFLVTTV